MTSNRIKSEYITQQGQHCGYVVLIQLSGEEFRIELHLLGISCPVILETETDREKAEKAFSDMLAEYCY